MGILNPSPGGRRTGAHLRQPAGLGCRLLLGLLAAWFLVTPVRAEVPKEYQIKAVFLFNFTQFINWPTNTFTTTGEPFTIGVLGDNPFGHFLEESVKNEKANDRPIQIKYFQRLEDVDNCQILYICPSEKKRIKTILNAMKSRQILTSIDAEEFAAGGGAVQFATEQHKIHLLINPEAAKNAGLTVSAKLLRLAEIVQPGKE